MEKQLDLVTKAKKQLIKLKYIEINIKSRCSIPNMIKDDVDLSFDCKYDNFPFPIFYTITLTTASILIQLKELLV
nr:hypothetical protein [Mesomycoplasma ovipneumoniae]